MEIFISILVASGAIGTISNLMVSSVKKLANLSNSYISNPRLVNAGFSLLLSLIAVAAGHQADMGAIQESLTIIVTAGGSWLVAHVLHRSNSL